MIEHHEKLILKTKEGENISLEVNWSDDPEVAGSKMLRLGIVDKMFHVKLEDLVAILLVCGDSKTQKSLVPVKVKNVKKLERRLHFRFRARKDYKEGEVIEVVAPWIDEVPTEEELMAGNLSKRKTKKLYGTK